MRLGVVSDSHNHVSHVLAATEVLRREHVAAIVHCGDVGGGDVVELFADWPTHFVAGNCDHSGQLAAIVARHGQTYHAVRAELELAGRSIAVLHSHVPGSLAAAIQSQQFDLVCYGHTHRLEHQQSGRTHILNPGALHRATTYTIAIVDLEEMTIRHLEVSCD